MLTGAVIGSAAVTAQAQAEARRDEERFQLDPVAEDLRRQTAAIRRSIELMREQRRLDALSSGDMSARSALAAMQTSFGLNQGDDPTLLVNGRRALKRSTLIAGTVSPSRASSAAVSATTNAPIATSSAAAVTATRSTTTTSTGYTGGTRSYKMNTMLE